MGFTKSAKEAETQRLLLSSTSIEASLYTGLFFDFYRGSTSRGDSSNVSEEDLFYQLPAQVGSSAPILGEVQSANTVEILWLFLRLLASRPLSTQASSLQAEETLATSPTEDLHYQLPAQVGSLAPILGEVQSAK